MCGKENLTYECEFILFDVNPSIKLLHKAVYFSKKFVLTFTINFTIMKTIFYATLTRKPQYEKFYAIIYIYESFAL